MLHVISMYNVLFSNIHGLDLDCGRRRAKISFGQKSGWTSRRPLQFFFFRQIFLPSPSHCALIGFSLVGEITNCPPVTKWCNHPGNTDHSVPNTDWGRGPFLLSTPPKPFSISVSVTNIWNLICC